MRRCRVAGRARTIGNRVYLKRVSRVRISPSPPMKRPCTAREYPQRGAKRRYVIQGVSRYGKTSTCKRILNFSCRYSFCTIVSTVGLSPRYVTRLSLLPAEKMRFCSNIILPILNKILQHLRHLRPCGLPLGAKPPTIPCAAAHIAASAYQESGATSRKLLPPFTLGLPSIL